MCGALVSEGYRRMKGASKCMRQGRPCLGLLRCRCGARARLVIDGPWIGKSLLHSGQCFIFISTGRPQLLHFVVKRSAWHLVHIAWSSSTTCKIFEQLVRGNLPYRSAATHLHLHTAVDCGGSLLSLGALPCAPGSHSHITHYLPSRAHKNREAGDLARYRVAHVAQSLLRRI
jgi:hypothetical protein